MGGAITPESFAMSEYRDYVTYRELAKVEANPKFKEILDDLVKHELEDYHFWLEFSSQKNHKISGLEIWLLKAMRRTLGLTFTAKFLEGNEKDAIRNYKLFMDSTDDVMREKVQNILNHEMQHERVLIDKIKEERIKFLGSIVLGVNDGLIELTGALVGIAFVLRDHLSVALLGAVTGIAASLSMAASAYMQARHEKGRDPKKAAMYTGCAYAIVVAALIIPIFLIPNIFIGLLAMLVVILILIVGFSFYSSVLFERDFQQQVGEMLLFSMGVALVAFILGSFARSLIGSLGSKMVQ